MYGRLMPRLEAIVGGGDEHGVDFGANYVFAGNCRFWELGKTAKKYTVASKGAKVSQGERVDGVHVQLAIEASSGAGLNRGAGQAPDLPAITDAPSDCTVLHRASEGAGGRTLSRQDSEPRDVISATNSAMKTIAERTTEAVANGLFFSENPTNRTAEFWAKNFVSCLQDERANQPELSPEDFARPRWRLHHHHLTTTALPSEPASLVCLTAPPARCFVGRRGV